MDDEMMPMEWNGMEEEGPYQKLVHEEWSGLRGRVAGVVTGRAAVRVTRIVAAAARSMHRLRRRRSHILDAQRQGFHPCDVRNQDRLSLTLLS